MPRLAGWSCADQDALHLVIPDPGRRAPKPPTLTTIGHLKCPRCSAAKVAIKAGPGHRLYGTHYIATEGGLRIPCGVSGARVCEIPRDAALPSSVYECPHPGGYPERAR